MEEPSLQTAVEHTTRCLRLNPMWQTDEILTSRATYLGLRDTQAEQRTAAIQKTQEKQALREELLRIRQSLWSDPLPGLQQRLSALQLDEDAQNRALAERLQILINVREQLPKLTEDKDFNGDLFVCMKTVLTGAPTEVSAMRERVSRSFDDRKLAKRGKRMIALLKRETPDLYGLEEDWLQKLQKKRMRFTLIGQSRDRTRESSFGLPFSSSWLWWFLLYILIKAIFLAGRTGSE